MSTLDPLEKLFAVWAFLYQGILIAHFAARKVFFESYTEKYGWIVYALCIPAVMISVILLRGGKNSSFWLGGFLCLAFSIFGFWVDYVARIPFRSTMQASIMVPYVILYLATLMFYWWPLWPLSRMLWFGYTILYVISTVLNIRSH